ncbi:MAG: SIMPL domain-containing protein [Gammaproteobacteria bacterium]|jgi:uncharacterized protein YggE
MLRPVLTLLALACVLSLPMPVMADDDPTVTATGIGHAEAVPDIAVLRFGVTSRQPTVEAGRDEVASSVARLIELARGFNLEDDHISTAALTVRPDTTWDPETRRQEQHGFVVSRQVMLKLMDLGQLGDLTERALGLGVTEASPASFDTSRRDELQAEALAAAARDARARATATAEALGAKVGKPLHLETGGGFAPPRPMMRAAMADANEMSGGETYQPGLIRVEAAVTATFELEH